MLKGSPKPMPGAALLLRVAVVCPHEALVVAGPMPVMVGLAKLLKLKTLKISARSSVLIFSEIFVCLKMDTSTVRKFGPTMASRLRLPYVPSAGAAKN